MVGCVIFNIVLWIIVTGVDGRNPQIDEPVKNLVEGYGYPFEVHEVPTEDDYLLGVHRIPGGHAGMPPVLIMHGLLGSSADWIISGPNRSLAFLLSDNGFDVWLPNNRGTTYSKDHRTMTSSSPQYWDFSWHEMGIYDAPAVIDYILAATNHTKLFYIGFSQGATQFFVMASMKPEYNNKVILMSSLAPAAYMTHVKGMLKVLSYFVPLGQIACELSNYGELLSNSEFFRTVKDYVCQEDSSMFPLCELIISLIGGFSEEQPVNTKHLVRILRNTPAGCSSKQLLHYGLGVISGHFRQYDYGIFKNIFMYYSFFPPDYDFSNVKVPVSIYYGLNDYISHTSDIAKLASQLPKVINLYTITTAKLNHFDFLFGRNIRELAYKRILRELLHYVNKI